MSEKLSSQTVGGGDASQRSMFLRNYTDQIAGTDKQLPKDDLRPVLLGLFGEVGSVMATAKKYHREKGAYPRYRDDLVEELGDTLWYFAALCRRLGYGIGEIFSEAAKGENYKDEVAASDVAAGPLSRIAVAEDVYSLDELLLELGQATSALLTVKKKSEETLPLLCTFVDCYLRTVQTKKKTTFAEIVHRNAEKARGRFLPDHANLPVFDDGLPQDERLPEEFRIEIVRRATGKSHMRWNGVFIGDPLTDNIINEDGYRFHDVFHLSYVAVLHWSPIFRGLIKCKRKSMPKIDEAEDGGRARVVEEGVSAWIFSQAKELDFFENQKRVSFGLLKGVQNFVKGYEVEKCPLWLWERAILEGYKVFRQVKENEGGIVIGNRKDRTISYEPLPKPKPKPES